MAKDGTGHLICGWDNCNKIGICSDPRLVWPVNPIQYLNRNVNLIPKEEKRIGPVNLTCETRETLGGIKIGFKSHTNDTMFLW